jgi:hypothetical protein
VPRLLARLRAFGIVISKRQVMRLLIAAQAASIRPDMAGADGSTPKDPYPEMIR